MNNFLNEQWEAIQDTVSTTHADGISTVCHMNTWSGWEDRAKLMAAAPELLAACIKQKALMDQAELVDKDLDAAIKKAIG